MKIGILFKILAAAALLATLAWPQAGEFESSGNVGLTPKTGAVEYHAGSGEYQITGGGANIWAAEDAFYFVWKRVPGDVTLSADVRFLGTGAVAHRKAVLMVRQDLTPGSAYADIALHGDGLTSLQFRPTAGAQTQEIRSTINGPTHLRIERRGNRFTVYANKPGEDPASWGPQTVELTGPVYVGLGVCSHDANVLETAVFSNVRLEQTQAVSQQRRYRSKITVYNFATRANEVVYQADQVIEAPNWSRDGTFLLVNTRGNLYRLPLNGGANPKLEQIDLGPAGYRCNNDHDLSRDGKWLAFSASSPASRQSQVYLAHSDGSDAKLMTQASPSYFHGWSPDGKWLAVVGQRNQKFELYRVPFTGGPEQRLTSKGGYDDGPEYSPDGKWIYFNSNRSGGWDIWRMPPEGAGDGDAKAERVTSDDLEDWFPHISPDGKWMIFLSFPKGTAGHNDKMDGVQLRRMPAPGKTLKPANIDVLTTFYGGQGTINVNSWSPDSKKFAYVAYEPLPEAQAAETTAPDTDRKLAHDIYKQFVEIKSGYTTGSTTPVAEAAAARLRAAGFADSDIFVGGAIPTKANLVVRYRGTGARKPILLLAHTDVVEAKREDWSTDPFQFIERDGYFYGRGTGDDKAQAAVWIANLIRFKREGFKPDRDIIVALTADEEGGGPYNGIHWLIKNKRDLIDAEFCLNEGGWGEAVGGKKISNDVQVSEKYVINFRLEVRNKGGHSSMPVADNAIYHLAGALDRLSKFGFPLKTNAVTRAYFQAMSKIDNGSLKNDLAMAADGSEDAMARVAHASPAWNATLRTTCVATMLEGGHAKNALPQLAAANVNCRVLPEDSVDYVKSTLEHVFADDQVKVTIEGEVTKGPASPMREDLFRAVSRLTDTMWPGVATVPIMVMGATDGLYLRAVGVPTYGVQGFFMDRDDIRFHGRDERMGVQAFYEGQAFLYDLVKALTTSDR